MSVDFYFAESITVRRDRKPIVAAKLNSVLTINQGWAFLWNERDGTWFVFFIS